MEIYEALSNDHEKLKPLLAQLVAATEADQGTKVLLDRINDLLIPHSRAEEAVFYNSLRDTDAGKDMINHSYREHAQAETMLRTLQGLEKINVEWTALAEKLRDALLQHIHEEEGPVFGVARETFSREEAMQMTIAFERAKILAVEQTDVKNTADLIRNMMPSRFRGAEGGASAP